MDTRFIWIGIYISLCSFSLGNTVQFRTAVVDGSGSPVAEVNVGESFAVEVFVSDIRPNPVGVFSGFLDIAYDMNHVVVDPLTIVHSALFEDGVNAEFTAGVIEETGGVGKLSPLGAGEFQLFSIDFVALSPGLVNFVGNPTDELPTHATTVIGQATAVSESEQVFVNTSLRVVPEPSGIAMATVVLLAFLTFHRRR